MKHFQHSPEVKEAIERFEKLTGLHVLKTRRYEGSMKYYVNFTIPLPFNKEFYRRFTEKKDSINGVKVSFINEVYKYPEQTNITIRWENLGMDVNNAFMPKFRGHE